MIRFTCFLVVALAILAGGCSRGIAAENTCHEELQKLPVAEAVAIDVEQMVSGIVEKMGTALYWDDVPSIATGCETPRRLPDQYVFTGSHGPSGVEIKPVQALRTAGLSGVIFAYHSRGPEEAMTGLAAALVEYDEDGMPGRVYKATELLGDEGWGRLSKSTFTAESVERCSQEIEYASYSPAGDIVGELETPARTPELCELILLLPE